MRSDTMKKKVLFVINTMGRAGAEKCLLSMMKYMDTEKYDISLFSIINRGEMFSYVPEGVRVLNEAPCKESVLDRTSKKVLAGYILKKGFQKGYFFKEAGYLWKMASYQRKHGGIDFKKLFWKLLSDHAPRQEESYDLAVAYIQGAATYYVMDHVKAKKKIAFLHNEFIDSGYCPALEEAYYEKADAIYCVSRSICDHFAQVYPKMAGKMDVFYNLLDTEEIREKALKTKELSPAFLKAVKERDEKNQILLLTAARIAPVKAYDLAVPALSIVRKQGYDVKWYVLGEGPERANVEALIKANGLEESFFLLGAVDNPYPYMAACDVYVQATRYEGCCTSISEAVILQKPVIASDCHGNKEQLSRYETGILVKLTPEGIAEGIIKAMDGRLRKELAEQANMSDFEPYKALERIYRFVED
ncbi:MAG: glycosyltransferase [Lachnospiraceae bacterium]|nr:glycosyltransferase [Lachnospiraceae bacterium]